MKIVKVTYTTKAEFAAQNKMNIAKVMADLREINNPDIRYDALVAADGQSFTHLAFFKTEEAQHVLGVLPSFIHFQQQLKESHPETPPKQEFLTLAGSTSETMTGFQHRRERTMWCNKSAAAFIMPTYYKI